MRDPTATDPDSTSADEQKANTETDAIPDTLRTLPRWIEWTLQQNERGKPTRRPHGSTRDLAALSTLDALSPPQQPIPRSNERGVGLVFTRGVRINGHRLLALDLDACVDPQADLLGEDPLRPWARRILDYACQNSYAELSPSGFGLRIFVLVLELDVPAAVPLVTLPEPGTTPNKRQQLQVFGCGAAGYVTVTGNRLAGTLPVPILAVGALDRLVEILPQASWTQRAHAIEELQLATGPRPELHAVEAAVRASPNGAGLVNGDWQPLGFASASEGWFALASATLAAARNHVDLAAEFLSTTAYGTGDVDSRDPGRYQRDEWVTTDLQRIAAKHGARGDVFDDGSDWARWQPPVASRDPHGTDDASKGPRLWFLPVAEYAQRAANVLWLYKRFLPAQGLAQIYGDPSSGKTAVAVDLAVHVALGLDWQGFALRRPGRVFYVAGEGGSGIGNRFRATLLRVAPLRSLHELDVMISDRAGAFIDPENRAIWGNHIRKVQRDDPSKPAALIVIDTLARNFGAGNENATDDMNRFVAECSELGRETGALVLLVHHTGHASKERGRGSSALIGGLDANVLVQRREGTRVVSIEQVKAKDWDEAPAFQRELIPVEVGVDEDDEPVTSITLGHAEPMPGDVFADAAPAFEPRPEDVAPMQYLLAQFTEKVPRRLGDREAFAKAAGIAVWAVRGLIQRAVDAQKLARVGSTRDSMYVLVPQASNPHSVVPPNSPETFGGTTC